MNNFNIKEKKKLHNIFLVLSGLFITNAIIAEILGTKIFDVSIIKDFSLSVGVVIWPVVFITTDIINEYFGKKGVKKINRLIKNNKKKLIKIQIEVKKIKKEVKIMKIQLLQF